MRRVDRRRRGISKVAAPRLVIEGYRHPPRSPEECTFARLTTCVSADFKSRVTPCQLGGKPVCAECGCIASAGMHAVASMKIGGLAPLSAILNASMSGCAARRRHELRSGPANQRLLNSNMVAVPNSRFPFVKAIWREGDFAKGISRQVFPKRSNARFVEKLAE